MVVLVLGEDLSEDINKKICLECQRQFTGIVAACPHDGSTLVATARDPLIGTCMMGKYDIIDKIGIGGMGVVYKGRQVLTERIVAIKMLQPQLIADSIRVKRFHQESKASSKLSHPHVITVYDFGVNPSSGQPFIVMDFLLGVSLADLIKSEGQISVGRSIKIFCQSTDAINHAHRMGVIHRDLKPSNIMLIDYGDEKDYVKVVDFGMAKLISSGGEQQKLTQMGEVCGSPVYMSPEQVRGLELDNRSDIYSMGLVIYETLTGHLPLLGQTMVETMSKQITEMPPRFKVIRPDLYIPDRLEAVVFKAIAKNPDDRQQTMAELSRELDTAIPRAGQEQTIRADFPTMSDLSDKAESKSSILSGLTLMHWISVASCLAIVISLAAFALLNNKHAVQSSVPATNGPPTVLTAPPPAIPSVSTTTSTTVAPKDSSTASITAPDPTSAPGKGGQSTSNPKGAGSAAAGTVSSNATRGDGIAEQSAKIEEAKVPRLRSKVAPALKVSHKHKHKVVAEPANQAPSLKSGAAAAYARRYGAANSHPSN